jgi:hypothetical protein
MRVKKRNLPAILIKAVASVFFILTAAAAAFWGKFPYSALLSFCILGGLLFGLLGDIWLDLKDMYAEHKDPYIFAGFSSFLVGHLFFIAGITAHYGFAPAKLLCAAAVAAFVTGFVLVSEKPMKLHYGKFKGITLVYSFVLTMMTATAAVYGFWPGAGPALQARVMAAGGALFLLSDLILSGTYFGVGKDKPVHIILNYLLYYGAQFTIAWSLLY